MTYDSRSYCSTICEICGNIFNVRKDFLKRKGYHYQCKSCAMKSVKRDYSVEKRLELSKIHRKFPFNENYFENLDSENKAYWLGFIAGDGNVTDHTFNLWLSSKDETHLLLLKRELAWNGKLLQHNKYNTVGFSIKSLKMTMDLANYGIIPNKTFILEFPHLNEDLTRHFIRGYFDADGCIYRARRTSSSGKNRRYIRYSGGFEILGNNNFLSDMQLELVRIGLPKTSLNYPNQNISRLRYGGIESLRIIYRYLYQDANIYMGRKQKLFKYVLDNYHSEIKCNDSVHKTSRE